MAVLRPIGARGIKRNRHAGGILLPESARDLLQGQKKIIDVAFEYRFNNPETYTRAFKRMFGVQPSWWKKRGWLDRRRLMGRLTPAHLAHRAQAGPGPRLERRGALHVAGLMTLVGGGREGIRDLWGMLADFVADRDDERRTGACYGVVTYLPDHRAGAFFYLAAVELRSPGVASPALVEKTIPALDWARFVYVGADDDLHLVRDYAYHTWLPRSEQQISYPVEVEAYERLPRRSTDRSSRVGFLLPVCAHTADDGRPVDTADGSPSIQ